MAKASSVWGLELGQSALKALRCKLSGDQVVAEAFDYIEYPKLLSQQDADPESMIREALQTFVGRNDLKNATIALSVAGQSGLAKFFKPPPVELKKMSDIVKYEARQQIPFELKDVSWDYQLMAGSVIENGFALESEVGLFAMKRDAVLRALRPLEDVNVEVDLLQLAPLSIYNAVAYDQNLVEGSVADYDSEHPPKSVVVLAMGTDATDLIVTNGYRLWQRSVPLGGNHFTRQLVKDLKLTFAKAEHLKRNAMEADDPKMVFQAMRPVFNDLVTEVQRSIGFFRSLHKKDEIGSILMLGNSVKLPGLAQFLGKQLSVDVKVLESFQRLSGDEVVSAPAFRDHAVSFAPVYGLCLQGLDKSAIYTDLMPHEVIKERLVRSKKPWIVAAAATLLLGMAGSLLPAGSNYKKVHESYWSSAISSADRTKSESDSLISEDQKQVKQVELLQKIGQEVSGSRDRRLLWLEILNALSQSLDRPVDFDPANLPDPKKIPFNERETIFITKVDIKFLKDLAPYELRTQQMYDADRRSRLELLGLLKDEGPAEGEDSEAADDETTVGASDGLVTGTSGDTGSGEATDAGWVFQLDGYHFHNDNIEGTKGYRATGDEQHGFVLKHLVHRLETGSAKLPMPNESGQIEEMEFTFAELGITRPFIVEDGDFFQDFTIANPDFKPPDGSVPGASGPGSGWSMGRSSDRGSSARPGPTEGRKQDPNNPEWFDAPKYIFSAQFVWRERPISARLEARRKAAEEAAAQKAAEAEAGGDDLASVQP